MCRDLISAQVRLDFVVSLYQEQMQQELVGIIRKEIGAVAGFRQSALVKRLPKTRSGKILRKTIRQLAVDPEVAVPPTIDDPAILDEIREAMQTCRIGQYAKPSCFQTFEERAMSANHT